MNRFVLIIVILLGISSHAQSNLRNFRIKAIQVQNDTIQIDSVSINPYKFTILDSTNQRIDSTKYKVDFAKAQLILNHKKYPKISIEYYVLPQFLTKTYSIFNKNLIVPKKTNISKRYSLKKSTRNQFFKPFDGLSTNGSISRGFTVGNNQDAVLNSNLDLQISGYLSEKVQLRASITDTNIPLQDGGYTQRLEEFDRVFIELFSENWSVKAGDISLQNSRSKSRAL